MCKPQKQNKSIASSIKDDFSGGDLLFLGFPRVLKRFPSLPGKQVTSSSHKIDFHVIINTT